MKDENLRSLKFKFAAWILAVVLGSFAAVYITLWSLDASIFQSNYDYDEVVNLIEQQEEYRDDFQDGTSKEALTRLANTLRSAQRQYFVNHMILITFPIAFISGTVGYWLALKMVEPIKESIDSQERFLQDAAHEMRNPLAAMSATVQALSEDPKIRETHGDEYKILQRLIKKLITINEDLLFLEREAANVREIKRISVSDVLYDVVEELHYDISQKDVEIELDIEDEVIYEMNIMEFVQLAKNLIENAVKYSGNDDPKVSISLRSRGSGFILEVEDNGVGIPEDDLEKVQERFYRAKNVVESVGSGLGLAIVNKVVNHYHGRLHLESEVGEGTKVQVTFGGRRYGANS